MKKETKNILLRGVPVDIANKLEKNAEENMRSVNKEAIRILVNELAEKKK